MWSRRAIALAAVLAIGCAPEVQVDEGDTTTGGVGGMGGASNVCGIVPVTDAASCTKTWIDDAFPAFQQMNCTLNNGGCHGIAPGKAQYHMPDADPGKAYDNLVAYVSLKTGKPYLNPANLQESYLLCNLQGAVGVPMPPTEGISWTDPNYRTIALWASCGAPRDGTGGPPP